MVADQSNMLDIFDRCNMEFFEGKLLFPQFDLLHSSKTCGYFSCRTVGWFDKSIYDPIISITDYYDFTEEQFVDIMVHEMIHYYLAYFELDRKGKHGKEFKKMADCLNLTYGLNVTPRLDLKQYKRNKGALRRTKLAVNNNNMRFFKEYNGFFIEFNSIGDYLGFLLGRLVGVIIFIGIIILIIWLI